MPEEGTADTNETLGYVRRERRETYEETEKEKLNRAAAAVNEDTDRKPSHESAEPTPMKNTHIPTHTHYSFTYLRVHHGSHPQTRLKAADVPTQQLRGSYRRCRQLFELAALEPTPSLVSALSQQFPIILTFGRTTKIHKVGVSKIQ